LLIANGRDRYDVTLNTHGSFAVADIRDLLDHDIGVK
jgi:hypothetical protein